MLIIGKKKTLSVGEKRCDVMTIIEWKVTQQYMYVYVHVLVCTYTCDR